MTDRDYDAQLQQGFIHLNQRLFSEAEAAFLALTQIPEYAALAWHGLSRVHVGRGELAEAVAASHRAIEINPLDARLHYAMGLQLQDAGQLELARGAFSQAVHLQGDLYQGWNNLGLVCYGLERYQEACAAYTAALQVKSDYTLAMNNLGLALIKLGDWQGAFQHLLRAVQREPAHPDYQGTLGWICLRTRRYQAALFHLGRAMALGSRDRNVFSRYAQVLEQVGQANDLDEALASLAPAEALDLMQHTVAYFMSVNQPQQTRAWCQRIVQRFPDNLRARLNGALALPMVLPGSGDIERIRLEYGAGLDALAEDFARRFAQVAPEPGPVLDLIQTSNFYLAYQGQDDRALQGQRAELLTHLLAQVRPDLLAPLEKRPVAGRRPIIGFASAHFRDRTVGHYFRAWITELDRTKFETRVYFLDRETAGGSGPDALAREIAEAADASWRVDETPAMEIDAIAERIRADACDVLIYPEVGMDTLTAGLALMRLAPVQCVAWGHPVTTGFPSLDYFISCGEMEPEGAAAHYAEKLLTLPGLGTAYRPAQARDDAKRQELGLPEDAFLFFYPHSHFKMHPEGDDLIARIFAEEPAARLVIFNSDNAEVVDASLSRIHQALVARGVDGERILALPPMGRNQYIEVASVCDLVLDTLHWSGGNTSLDAFTAGTPVVTLPGAFMRGRQTLGMLQRMEIPELVAANGDDYVAIALRLVRDPAWRASIVERIVARRPVLFDDKAPIRALETLLQEMVA